MKKRTIVILTIIAVIIIAVVAIVGIVVVKLNKEKNPLTTKEFISKMIDKGYTVIDAKDQLVGYDKLKAATIALSKSNKYQFEFYELEDEDSAKEFYNYNKKRFESVKENNSKETSKEFKNYSKYTLTTDGKYKVISRIDNTVMYLDVDENYKDTVTSVLKEFDY